MSWHLRSTRLQRIEHWATRQQFTRPSAEEIVVVPHEKANADTMMAQTPMRTHESASRAERFE